ncbi:hypothetical protein [Paraburkholderia sacchari]|uniref:hypothetical protein n=1 Tax=Paraburkholderia sacchari TaxID=159450 RepID=UPI001BCFAD96|nr:hypothetical protein [Paraburkholderia sacchari]
MRGLNHACAANSEEIEEDSRVRMNAICAIVPDEALFIDSALDLPPKSLRDPLTDS